MDPYTNRRSFWPRKCKLTDNWIKPGSKAYRSETEFEWITEDAYLIEKLVGRGMLWSEIQDQYQRKTSEGSNGE